MKTDFRFFRVVAALPVALAILLYAPTAGAFLTGGNYDAVTNGLCLDPNDVVTDITALVDAEDFSPLENKQCKNVCKEFRKACEDTNEAREDCIKGITKAGDKIQKEYCKTIDDKDAEKTCKDDAKDDRKDCDKTLKDDVKQVKKDCKDILEAACTAVCNVQTGG